MLGRFGVIVDKIVTELITTSSYRVGVHQLSQQDLTELANAHAQMMLVESHGVRDAAEQLWDKLQSALIEAAESGAPIPNAQSKAVLDALDVYWRTARASVPDA